jgi:hypothetical protein
MRRTAPSTAAKGWASTPGEDGAILLYLLIVGGVVALLALGFYSFMNPTVVPNPGSAAYRPLTQTSVKLSSPSEVAAEHELSAQQAIAFKASAVEVPAKAVSPEARPPEPPPQVASRPVHKAARVPRVAKAKARPPRRIVAERRPPRAVQRSPLRTVQNPTSTSWGFGNQGSWGGRSWF